MEGGIKQKTIILRLNFKGFMETDPWMVTFWVSSKGLDRLGGKQEHSRWSWRKEIRIYFQTFSWLLELMGHTCAIGRKLQNKTIYFLNPWINPAHDNLQNGSYLLTKFTVLVFFCISCFRGQRHLAHTEPLKTTSSRMTQLFICFMNINAYYKHDRLLLINFIIIWVV